MRVFLTGASGVLGRALARLLVSRGHTVVGSARSDRSVRLLQELGALPSRAGLFDADALTRAARGCHAVIHGATSIPIKSRPLPRDWRMNDKLRREGSHALTECAARVGASVYLQQSIAWVARPAMEGPDEVRYSETSPPHPDSVTQSALDGERIALRAGEQHGYTATVLRCGMFYGAEASHTQQFANRLRKRQFPVIGEGNGLLNLLHVEDAAAAFVAAAENPKPGLWHVVDDHPVTVRDFLNQFARLLKAPTPRRAPAWLVRLLAGKTAVELFTSSAWTTNELFRKDFPWRPRYPSFREGLSQIVREWEQGSFSA